LDLGGAYIHRVTSLARTSPVIGPATLGMACRKHRGKKRKAISDFELMNEVLWLKNLFGYGDYLITFKKHAF